MIGALLVAGTHSDAGKSVVTAGICRWLRRRGVRVAPFKAQNMSNNSAIALAPPVPAGENGAGGVIGAAGEIGRAQAMQAAACGLAPDVRFNPVLLKPASDLTSQVVLLGQPVGEISAGNFRELRPRLAQTAFDALAELRREYDVVICEGAGSPAEINLRDADFVNMGLARAAGLPTIVVGDIDRGGVFASLYGTLALLDGQDQALIAGFVINRFRGDERLLAPGLDRLTQLTGRPTLGVLPFHLDLWLDAEDSLAYGRVLGRPAPPVGAQWLRVAVIRLPHISNATDAEALATEPGVRVRLTVEPAEIDEADLVVLPGSKSTVDDLRWLRETGLAGAVQRHAVHGRPVLGICGGYQMLARSIEDFVESKDGNVPGLGLAPVTIAFASTKTLARSRGSSDFGPVAGYEIHYGQEAWRSPGVPGLIRMADGAPEGVRHRNIFGTHWHGAFESDEFRRGFLTEAARLAGRGGFRVAPDTVFAAARERMLDLLGDLVDTHLDTDELWRLIEKGAPADLPTIGPGVEAASSRAD